METWIGEFFVVDDILDGRCLTYQSNANQVRMYTTEDSEFEELECNTTEENNGNEPEWNIPYFEIGSTSGTFHPRFGIRDTVSDLFFVSLAYETCCSPYYSNVDKLEARSTDFDNDGDTDLKDKIFLGRRLHPNWSGPVPSWCDLDGTDPGNPAFGKGDYMVLVNEMVRGEKATHYCGSSGMTTMPWTYSYPDSIAPNAVTLSVSDGSGGSKIISWTAPGDDWGYGWADGYDIRWSACPITEQNWESCNGYTGTIPTPGAPGTSESITITSPPNGAIHWALKTGDFVSNYSPLSNVVTISQKRVCDLKICAKFKNCALVGWTSLGGTEVDLRYSTSQITSSNFSSATPVSVSVAGEGQTQEVMIDGLSASTHYWFAVKWKDSSGNWSPLSVVPHGSTLSSGVSCNYQTACTWDGLRARPAPMEFGLDFAAPMPNPARNECLFRFTLPYELESEEVELTVFDIAGRRRALVHNAEAIAGPHEVSWNLRDESGHSLGKGVYFARLRVGDQLMKRTLVIGH